MTVNSTIIDGRLTKDVEVRATTTGKHVAQLSLAFDGTSKDKTNFIDVVAWEKLAELMEKMAQKGTRVLVCGRLEYQEFTTKNGEKRNKHLVVANDIQILSGFKPKDQTEADKMGEEDNDISVDEIPF